MTKEEKIKEAYIEYWEQLSDSAKFTALNNNGWLHYNHIVFSNGTLLDCIEMDFISDIDVFRPKSLQGIENNNGWIKIESDDCFPNDNKDYWVIRNGVIAVENIPSSRTVWWINNVTHYQPIQKPKQPIY